MVEKNIEKFMKVLKEEDKISQDSIDNMRAVADRLIDELKNKAKNSGLLYGRVQSGKTNNMIMSIANLIDSGKFKLIIVLTSDNTSLYDQTLSRITKGLNSIGVIGYKDITNESENKESIKTKVAHNGAVIVCTKNSTNLKNLNEFLEGIDIPTIGTVILDDEADFGSLNSRQNDKDESAVFSLIETLRKLIPDTRFIEVTATPQANLLQKPNDPRFPTFIIPIPSGSGYVGGSELYDLQKQEVVERHNRVIPENEIELITKGKNQSATPPETIYQAVCTFFMGGAMKYLLLPEQKNFSMLVHISAKVSVNKELFNVVSRVKNEISEVVYDLANGISANPTPIEDYLKAAYDDIKNTLEKGNSIKYEKALETISTYIDQCKLQKIISGKLKGDPNYDSFYNILIGGNRLGRGLTVKNLTVFYYARLTGAPKVDTILQHSRVYGYREKILDIIRIFSTDKMFDNLYDVYMSDQEEWEYVNNNIKNITTTNLPVFLSLKKNRGITPTRTQVIPKDNILKYFPGKTYFMYHAKESNLDEIDKLLDAYKDGDPASIVKLELAEKLIELTDTSEQEQRWKKDAIKTILEEMSKNKNNIYLMVRRNSDLKKDYHAVLTAEEESKIVRDDGPIIFMLRTSGKGEDWNGEIAWIPVIRLPVGSKAYYLSNEKPISDEGEEKNHGSTF